jgi:hypothetical protein
MAIKLGKQTFKVPTPKGMRSFALQQRILPVASRLITAVVMIVKDGGIPEIPTDDNGEKNLLNVDLANVLPSALPYLSKVFSDMPSGELEAITKELLKDATFDGHPLFSDNGEDAFDGLMAGRNLDIWKLLWHALQVWYPDFFGLAATFAAKKDAGASGSKESTTSATPGPASA